MISRMPSSTEFEFHSFVSAAENRASAIIKENPALLMLVVFGVGMSVGVLLSEFVAKPRQTRAETMAERIGRQICERLNLKF